MTLWCGNNQLAFPGINTGDSPVSVRMDFISKNQRIARRCETGYN